MPSAIGTDTITSLSRRMILPEIVDAVYNSNPLFFRLTKANKKVVQGGTHIEKPIQVGRPNQAGAYSGFDVLNTAPFDVIQNARWDWKQYATIVTIDGLTMIKTDTPEAIANFIRTQFELAKADFAHTMGADIYAGNGTDPKRLTGLSQAVAASGTYAEHNHASVYWQSTVDTTALSSLTLDHVQGMFSKLVIGRESPTIIMCRRPAYDKLWALIYGAGGTPQITIPAGGSDEILASAGFTNILFNNVPVVIDSQVDDSLGTATNGKLYMLNENWIELAVSPRADMAMEDFVTPANQDVMSAKILWAGELLVSNPRLQGVFTSL